jgi:hypothetical protein
MQDWLLMSDALAPIHPLVAPPLPEIVPQFVNERLADLVADFRFARIDRFDVLLIKHDVAGPVGSQRSSSWWLALRERRLAAIAFADFSGIVTDLAGNLLRESQRSGDDCEILPAANPRLLLQPRRNLHVSSFTH